MSFAFDLPKLTQIGVFLLAVLLGWLFGRLAQRRLAGIDTRLERSWLGKNLIFFPGLAAMLGRAAPGLFIYGLGMLGGTWLSRMPHPTSLLAWLLSFLPYVVFYQMVAALLERQLGLDQAKALERYVLGPVTWVLLGLHALGFTDDVLAISFQPGQNPPISFRAVLVSLLTLYLFYMAARALRGYMQHTYLPNAGASPALSQVSSRVLFYLVLVLGLLVSLNAAGVQLTALAVVAGGLSVGVGFGLQALFNNLVSGFIVLLERSVVPGDVVKIGDQVGTVRDIRLRSTIVRTPDELDLVVPNSKFLEGTLVNYTRNPEKRQVNVKVRASASADPRLVEKLLLQAAQHPVVLSDPAPVVLFSGFGESSLEFDLFVNLSDSTQVVRVASDIRYKIVDLFRENGVEMPVPQRDVTVKSLENEFSATKSTKPGD